MADLYTSRLFQVHALNGVVPLVVPSTERWVIRTVTLFIPGPLGGIAQFVDHASDTTFFWYLFSSVPAGGFYATPDTRLVLMEGSQTDIGADGGGGEGIDITAHGFVLTLP